MTNCPVALILREGWPFFNGANSAVRPAEEKQRMASTNNRGKEGKRSGSATSPAKAGSQSPQTGKSATKSGPKKK